MSFVDRAIASHVGGGRPLLEPLRTRAEAAFGVDLAELRVHHDSDAPFRLGALAFTRGVDIHFAPGAYNERTLGHEITHVIQQAQGRVRPTAQIGGLAINEDPALEREADRGASVLTRSRGEDRMATPGWRSQVVRRLGNHAPVQRTVRIDGKAIAPSDQETEFRNYLERHAIHYMYGYGNVANEVDADGDKQYAGQEGARQLAARLGELFDAKPTSDDEVQTHLQRKLVEIAELVRISAGIGETQQAAEARALWYSDFILNGLCVGFVKVFENHPSWTFGLWAALQSWKPSHGASVVKIIDDLNRHIEDHMRFADGLTQLNYLEPFLLAREAWEAMGGEYQAPPDFVQQVSGTAAAHTSTSIGEKVWQAPQGSGRQRWGEACEYIIETIGNQQGWFHVIVYTEKHEMAVRVHADAGKISEWTVVETQNQGILRCNSWQDVGAILGPRLAEAESEFGVDVKRQA